MSASASPGPDLYLACLNDLRLGVAVFDANQELIFHNPRFIRLMRLPADFFKAGVKYVDLVQFNRARGVFNDTDKDHKAEKRLSITGESRAPYRATLVLPWGDTLTMRLQPLDQGCFMITYRRITRRRAVEKQVAAALEQARSAAQKAELANRSKTGFLANMSHELRTPLNAIIGFADIMRNELKGPLGNPEYKKYAADIAESSEHLLQIINDLLDISKIESGKLDLREENLDLARAYNTCVTILRERAQQGGVTLLCEALPRDIYLRADARMIKQILINLVANAVKFTPPKGRVTLGAKRETDGSVTMSISDTGIGIAAEDIDRVLEPFIQADNDLARHYEGTGLGLPLAKALTELHDGRLEIESSPGTGTTVTVNLPAERVLTRAA
jgi:signal transduction histidine kinase